MKKADKRRTGKLLLWLLALGMLCVIVIMGLLCYLCMGMRREIRINQQTVAEEETIMSEKIKQLETEIKSLNEKVAELKKQKYTVEINNQSAMEEDQSQSTEEISGDELEKNAVIGPPANTTVSIDQMEVGQIIDASYVLGKEAQFFKSYEIEEGDEVYNRINGKSYYPNENIGLSDLHYLKLAHYNFSHQVQVGELIVNAAVSNDVINIFKELFAAEYEIQSMRLIDDYWTGDGDSSDSNSIDNNNTSAFCYRQITGGGRLSNHAYGRAIDINPQQNPYVWNSGGQLQWSHENASPYIDRSSGDPHVIVQEDICYSIFAKYGFSWGGLWNNPIDYQHFEKK